MNRKTKMIIGKLILITLRCISFILVVGGLIIAIGSEGAAKADTISIIRFVLQSIGGLSCFALGVSIANRL